MNNNAYIVTAQAMTVYLNGKVHTIHGSDPRYAPAIELLKAESWDDLEDLLKPTVRMAASFAAASNGTSVEVRDGDIYYAGEPLHNYVATKALEIVRAGLNVQPILNFIERVMKNPSGRAVQELFGFLEVGQLPITSDGCFLAYKMVRSDYMDQHSGTNDNSVGQVVQMPRNQVDDDPTRTCSYGLHFASRDYVTGYFSGKLMVLKIDPADVVAIPIDYDNTKGRCARYEVVAELEATPEEKNAWGRPVVDDYEADEDEGEDDDDDDVENGEDYSDPRHVSLLAQLTGVTAGDYLRLVKEGFRFFRDEDGDYWFVDADGDGDGGYYDTAHEVVAAAVSFPR